MIEYLGKAVIPNHGSPLFVDGCAGLGGHSKAILTSFPTSHLLCIDRDPIVGLSFSSLLFPDALRIDVSVAELWGSCEGRHGFLC